MPAETTLALEAPEVAGHRDLWAAVPPELAARFGIADRAIGPGRAMVAAGLPDSRLLNHALGVPATAEALDALEAFAGAHGTVPVLALREGAPGEKILRERNYTRGYAWVKFTRAPAALAPPECPLRVGAVPAGEGDNVGTLMVRAFGLPEDLVPWLGSIAGRPSWHCLGAYAGPRLVATGSLFAHRAGGWLGFAATDPEHRGRGAQKALLAARIGLAHRLGLTLLAVETGERVPGQPDPSYRNILGAGLRPVYRRPFWRGSVPVA